MARAAAFGQWNRPLVAGPCLLVLLASGCGSKTGTVSGKVTHQGKAVSNGFISFLPQTPQDQGRVFSSIIDENGAYEVTRVPVGPAKIVIQNPGARSPVRAAKQKKATGKQSAISATSQQGGDLTFTVCPGNQQHDIELP
jgi:hypothetical protein